MRLFEQYDEICKYFTEGKQRDNNANEIQKHLQLYNLSLGEYLVNKHALCLNAYIYLIMDAQLNIQNGAYVSAVY